MRATVLALALLVPTACAPPPQAAPEPATPEMPESDALATVSFDAEPLALSGIVIDGRGPNLARMTLSTAELSCELAPRDEDEQRLTLTMVRQLGEKDQWRIARLRADMPNQQGESIFALRNAPVVQLPTTLAKTAKASAHFNIPLELDGQTVRFEIGGDLPATGCGSLAATDAPAEHASLSMTVAGEAIPIAGATYRRDPKTNKHRIALSSSAMDCDGHQAETEIAVDLTLDRIGRSVRALGLDGMRVGEDLDTEVDASAIRTKLQGLGKAVRLSLDGNAEVGGYPVTFAGQTDITYCH